MGNMGILATRIWDKYGTFSVFLTKIWDKYGTNMGHIWDQRQVYTRSEPYLITTHVRIDAYIISFGINNRNMNKRLE